MLVAFGVGALSGTTVGGRLGDRWPLATTITASVAASLVLLLLTVASRSPVAAIVLVVLMGLTGFAVNPVVSALVVRFAGDAPTLASALSTSAFNVGIAVGSFVAGLTLTTGLGLSGPSLAGAAATGLTMLPLAGLAASKAVRYPAAGSAPMRTGAESVRDEPVSPTRSTLAVG